VGNISTPGGLVDRLSVDAEELGKFVGGVNRYIVITC
jgi:hypothetical protein